MEVDSHIASRLESESKKDAALAYARKGWRVFPIYSVDEQGACTCQKPDCDKPGKHPRTKHGHKDACLDEKAIQGWWTRWPDANVGIATGRVSGLVVLDVDPRHGGVESYEQLKGNAPSVAPEVKAYTTHGGFHLYFSYPHDRQGIRSTTSLAGLPGLDVRADGGYVVAPPSKGEAGEYQWDAVTDFGGQLPPMPKWLLDATSQHDTKREATRFTPAGPRRVTEALQGVSEGSRNVTAARLAGYLIGKGLPEDITYQTLVPFAERCQPPMNLGELRRVVESVWGMEQISVQGKKKGEGLEVRSLPELLAHEYTSEPVIEEGYLDQGGMMLVVGESEIGKSWLLLQMAMDLATGGAFLDRWSVVRPFNVLLVQGEIAAFRFQERAAKLTKRYGEPANLYLSTAFDLKLDDPAMASLLEEQIERCHADVLLLDPVRPFFGGDENSSQDVEKLFAAVRRLQEQHGVAVVLAHHTRKGAAGQRGDSKDDARGSSLFTDRPDTVLGLHTKDRSVKLSVHKLRNGSDGKEGPFTLGRDAETAAFHIQDGGGPTVSPKTVLEYLNDGEWHPFSAVKADLARQLGVGEKSVANQVNKMVGEGLLEQTTSETDGRAKLVRLAPRGEEIR